MKTQARKTETRSSRARPFFSRKSGSTPFFSPVESSGGTRIQAKPEVVVAPEDDPLEREADAAADRVVQRRPVGGVGGESNGANGGGTPVGSDLAGRLGRRRGGGEPLPAAVRREMESAFGAGLGEVRTHRDSEAAGMAGELNAQAFTRGSDIYFNRGMYSPDTSAGKHLLAHELTHVLQQGSARGAIQRVPAAPTPIARRTATQLLGDGSAANPGLTLRELEQYSRVQADWFTEPTLTTADREDLWSLLEQASRSPGVLDGVGDVRVSELRPVTSADWVSLRAFCRGADPSGDTVRIVTPSTYPLARRVDLGSTVLDLEALVPPAVLWRTVSELQLAEVESGALMAGLNDYWRVFGPELERAYVPAPGARGLEFQRILDLVGGPGIAPFMSLQGSVRNLHRFSALALARLVMNFGDTSRSRPVFLVLHSGHDAAGAFQDAAHLIDSLILGSPNLVLMLEGQGSLAAITAEIPVIASRYGQPDGSGGHHISQAMIAGHGLARSIELAGTGAPTDSGNLDLDNNLAATNALFDALLSHLDPATARLVFSGCLVGSNPVPIGTAQADISTTIAAHPSLATHAESRGTSAHGLPAGFVSAARASVAGGAITSLTDAAGNLAIQYPFDPAAFGSAAAYAASGREPEGVLTAAIEVAGSSTVAAENQLRVRLAMPELGGWLDQVTRVVVGLALDGVAPGAGIDVARVNALAHAITAPLLVRWPRAYEGVSVASVVAAVSFHPFASDLYSGLIGTERMTSASTPGARAGRLILEQAFMAHGGTREGPLLAFLDAHPELTVQEIREFLDPALIVPDSPTLFPAGAAATPGRVRLALAWLMIEPANPLVRAFLDAQVNAGGSAPTLNGAVQSQLGTLSERTVLEALGRLTPTTPVPAGGATAPVPNANAALTGSSMNDIRIEPSPHTAIALPAGGSLDVRPEPDAAAAPFGRINAWDDVQVVGEVDAWLAIDLDGRLGFVRQTDIL